jgi:hypothetical protein
MKSIYLITAALCILLISCETKTGKKVDDGVAREYYPDGVIKSETQVKDTIAHGLRKQYNQNGGLKSVYTFHMGKPDGPAVSYYPSGKIEYKMFYKDGKREGTTLWYYNSGELYRSIPYKNGKINGIKISYYKDGKIMAEAPVQNDLPGIGLKEYTMKGDLIDDNTKILVDEDNRLFAENLYTLNISLNNPKSGISYYLGELADGKFIGANQWQMPEKNGVAYYSIRLEKGEFRMETLVITASYKTNKSNYRVISRKYNLAIDNK